MGLWFFPSSFPTILSLGTGALWVLYAASYSASSSLLYLFLKYHHSIAFFLRSLDDWRLQREWVCPLMQSLLQSSLLLPSSHQELPPSFLLWWLFPPVASPSIVVCVHKDSICPFSWFASFPFFPSSRSFSWITHSSSDRQATKKIFLSCLFIRCKLKTIWLLCPIFLCYTPSPFTPSYLFVRNRLVLYFSSL